MISKVRSAAGVFFFPTWSIPFALLAVTLLTYGLRARGLGFFWDDWPYLWFFDRFGPAGIIDAFDQDRPFLSFIYTLSLTLLGHSTQGWQVFSLLARWLCSLGLWWALAVTWPHSKQKAAWVALLFTVYPGFTQQWISVIYGQAFFLFAAMFFSIGLTLWLARRRPLNRWVTVAGTLLALALSAFTMFSTEYFFGLELLRPALLWWVFADEQHHAPLLPRLRSRLLRIAAWWAPYLALMVVFVVWRGFIHVFPAASLSTLDRLSQAPLATLQHLFLTMVEDLVEASLVAWGQPLQLAGFIENGVSAGLRLLAVILGAGLLVGLYLARLRSSGGPADRAEHEQSSWAWQAILTGLFALMVAGWPFWITGLSMRMGFPLDRYSLPLSVGVCLVLAGLVDALAKNSGSQVAVLSLAVALAAGFHFNNALVYRQDWNEMRSFFWQLTWRAPEIQPGTLILTESLPFRFYEDDSLTAPLNWTYDPDGKTREMGYLLYDLRVRNHSLPDLIPGFEITRDFRSTEFTGSTSQVLVVHYDPPGCVRILDPEYDRDFYLLPDGLQKALAISNPRLLVQDHNPAAAPPVEIFGEEPRHRWCYYYAKAELARQNENWEEIVSLSRDSIGQGYRPDDPAEYLPFIEGFGRAGYFDDADRLVTSALREEPSLRPAVCAVWRRIYATTEGVPDVYRDAYNRSLNCLIPPSS